MDKDSRSRRRNSHRIDRREAGKAIAMAQSRVLTTSWQRFTFRDQIDPTVVPALRHEEKAVVTDAELQILPSRNKRRRAVKQAERIWKEVATVLESLQNAQLELARLIKDDAPEHAITKQREVVKRLRNFEQRPPEVES